MNTTQDGSPHAETQIKVRYWAAARAAAGVGEDVLEVTGPLTVEQIRERALALHPDADGLDRVIAACSVVIDDQPMGRRTPDSVRVAPGQTVEFLPPFAGG